MITKAKRNKAISVVDDMHMSPTYTRDAAEAIKKALESQLPFGVYHATNQGECTWFQFAKLIFTLLNLNPILQPIKTNQLHQKAKKPKNSALISTKLPKHGIKMRGWEEALKDYLAEKGYM